MPSKETNGEMNSTPKRKPCGPGGNSKQMIVGRQSWLPENHQVSWKLAIGQDLVVFTPKKNRQGVFFWLMVIVIWLFSLLHPTAAKRSKLRPCGVLKFDSFEHLQYVCKLVEVCSKFCQMFVKVFKTSICLFTSLRNLTSLWVFECHSQIACTKLRPDSIKLQRSFSLPSFFWVCCWLPYFQAYADPKWRIS